jgi:hypothetical protein
MRTALLIACIAFLPAFSHGQQAPPAPQCNSYVIQKQLNDDPGHFSLKQRLCTYGGKLISGQAFFGPIFMGGVAQWRDDPQEWGQGTKGYLRRVGSRYAQGVAKSTGDFVFSYALHEDPRYEPSRDKGFWKRTGYALSTVVVVYHLRDCQLADATDGNRVLHKCRKWPAISRMVGASSSGLVGLSWYPERLNTPGQVLARTGSAYGGYVASAIFSEFQADIFRLLGKVVGSDRNNPSQPKDIKVPDE